MTKHLTFRTAVRMFFGPVILLMASLAAHADPTTLSCSSSTSRSLGPDVFVLNEAQGTVTIAFAPFQFNGGVSPARSSGPLSATFTPDVITISHDGGNGQLDKYVINRSTATVELTQSHNNNVDGVGEWTCHVSAKQF